MVDRFSTCLDLCVPNSVELFVSPLHFYHLTTGVAAAIISHPADTLLSKVNKKGAGGTGSTVQRLMNIAKEMGFYKLCTTGITIFYVL